MKFQIATQPDTPVIQHIAITTWYVTYADILSKEQIDYMLDLFYSTEKLTEQIINKDQLIYIAKDENNTVLGFFAIEHFYDLEFKTKLHKIYILPENQGNGIGKLMMDEVIRLSKINQSKTLILNVNRNNKSLYFYQKLGFENIQTVDIEIGNGYLMEDFVLEKKL